MIRQHGLPVIEIGLHSVVCSTTSGSSTCRALTILETAELLRRASLFIGIDSGPAHLAHAVGTPGVILLGSTAAMRDTCPTAARTATGASQTVLHAEGPASTLSVADVLAAATDRLTKHEAPAPPVAAEVRT
jgi:heptosyltransferase-3